MSLWLRCNFKVFQFSYPNSLVARSSGQLRHDHLVWLSLTLHCSLAQESELELIDFLHCLSDIHVEAIEPNADLVLAGNAVLVGQFG